MMDYMRQRDLVDADTLARTHIDLVGLGGIGSPTGLLLTKMGCRDLRAFDGDHVEAVNLSSQLYRLEDAERRNPKALACQEIWRAFSDVEVAAVCDSAETHILRGIVLWAVDSMDARKVLWERLTRGVSFVPWLVDARMGAESGTLLSVRPALPGDRRWYESTLYEDAHTLDLPCTGRAVFYNTLWLAALIGRQVKRIVMGQRVERRIDFDLDQLTLLIDG